MEQVAEGVKNLIENCAQVQRGEKVLVLNERGEMESDLVDLIAGAIRDAGATPQVLWADPIGQGPFGEGAASLPDELVKAITSADKVIAHYPIRDRLLARYLGDAPRVTIVHSMFRTKDDFASEHARFHWGMAKAIYDRFQKELFAEGRRWRFATLAGTDISGLIGPFSERARQLEDEIWPFSRSFNSPAFIPVASTHSEGKAVIEYTAGFRRVPIDHPPTIVVENNLMVRVEGPPEAKRWVDEYAKILDERLERLSVPDANRVDSWHGGLHPTAECTPGPRGMIGNASTKMMHFHVGPDGAHVQAQLGDVTLELDGEKVLEGGKYAPGFDDPKLRDIAHRFGLKHWR